MTVRSFNDSVLNEHIESITFCELNNEDEGKVTSMDKRSWPVLCFYYVSYLATLPNTKLYNFHCCTVHLLNYMVLHTMQRDIKKLVHY
jgi:hypothetical protein